jgi:disulfide bond formation protein DsbB
MAKLQRAPRRAGAKTKSAQARKEQLPLPDPKLRGPFRPFTDDPDWNEAWWWLGIPAAAAIFVVASFLIDPDWHRHWVTREGPGVLETAQFVLMVIGFALAVQLLFDPFVRRRPFVLAVTIVSAISCLYIAGEEVSWGQHIFFWQDPGLLSEVNDEGEFSIHNVNKAFERTPRTLLELGVLVGGLVMPAVCAFLPRLRQSRAALFLPSAALVPTALFMLAFKIESTLSKFIGTHFLAARSSEAVEFYLYFFILAYLIVFERRIREIETADSGKPPRA